MIYRHTYFTLDTEAKTVSDENGKPLAFTEYLFRALHFLCEYTNIGTDEFGDLIGGEESDRLYDHNAIRQYKYWINKLLGHDVVHYKEQRFFIDGEVMKGEEAPVPAVSVTEDSVVLKAVFSKKIIVAIVVVLLVSAVSLSAYAFVNKPVVLARPKSNMILIPAGNFFMGSTEEQALQAFKMNGEIYEKESYLAEYPKRTVFLPDYSIDKREVSNDEYTKFSIATGYKLPDISATQNLNAPNQPVVGVDWDDASAYCTWVGKRLPTEAEWEKAARGTDGRIFSWGNEWDPSKDNHGSLGMYRLDESDGFVYTAPVATELGVSPYGVLNMSGNAYEWTSDDYNTYPGNDKYSYVLLDKGAKVMKGGAFDDGPLHHFYRFWQ